MDTAGKARCDVHSHLALLSQRITELKVQTERRRLRRSVAAFTSAGGGGQDREHDAEEERALAVIQQASADYTLPVYNAHGGGVPTPDSSLEQHFCLKRLHT